MLDKFINLINSLLKYLFSGFKAELSESFILRLRYLSINTVCLCLNVVSQNTDIAKCLNVKRSLFTLESL